MKKGSKQKEQREDWEGERETVSLNGGKKKKKVIIEGSLDRVALRVWSELPKSPELQGGSSPPDSRGYPFVLRSSSPLCPKAWP